MEWILAALSLTTTLTPECKRGGIGRLVSFFIRIVIYDICITGISDIFNVSRMVALFIFLGILGAISVGGYILKQKMSQASNNKPFHKKIAVRRWPGSLLYRWKTLDRR